MALLAQGIGSYGAAGSVESTGKVALCFQNAAEPEKDMQIRLRQPRPLQKRPLVVAAGEQLALIQFRGLTEAAEQLVWAPGAAKVPQRGFEGGNVRGDRLGVETDGGSARRAPRSVICHRNSITSLGA
jgi:hypothetical protein